MSKQDRYLILRRGLWYYKRRVPKKFKAYDSREFVRKSLGTDTLEIARLRRDALEQADDDFWANVIYYDAQDASDEDKQKLKQALDRKYELASSRALARGFVYAPADKLAETAELTEIMDRLQAVAEMDRAQPNPAQEAEAAALLGAVDVPQTTIWQAFDIYCDEIAIGDLVNKSPKQKALWLKTKRRGINYFVDLVGDKPMIQITREDARSYYNWWAERLIPSGDAKPLKANTANRDIGNMRLLYSSYFTHLGDETRDNPFRNLSFKDSSPTEVPPFEDKWVREKILVPGAFGDLNTDALMIIYALIETGCRPAEIANLAPDDIRLDAEVPYIHIRPREGREIKTQSSIRKIPLVGVSLKAMKHAPKGFHHYRDRNDLLSATLMKSFRQHKLFPTKSHIVYSFRHAFEKRMLEAELDYGFRCMMMGHRHNRPKYGDGGSMEYRRDQLLKIVHPVPNNLFE